MLIKFLGFILLLVFVLIAIGIFILYRTVRMFLFGNKKSQYTYTQSNPNAQTRRQTYQQTTQSSNSSNDDTTPYESYHGSKEWYASPGRKKIFGEDEGEYVEFEEVKE